MSELERLREENMLLKTMVAEAQDRELRNIADAIHSGPGALTVYLGLVLNEAARAEDPAMRSACLEKAQRTREELYDALTNIQFLADPFLNSSGLYEVITRLCRVWQQRYPSVEFVEEIHSDVATKNSTAELAVYRIISDALNNIAKHSRATRVEVWLTIDYETNDLVLEVKDNGIGMEPGHHREGGRGLRSMQSRVAAVGGTLEIHTAPNEGMRISAVIPAALDIR